MTNPLGGVLARAAARWLRGCGAVCTDGAARTMNQFDVVQGFLKSGEAGAPPDQPAAELLEAVQAFGFRHLACCSDVDPFNPPAKAVMRHNHLHGWVRTYCEAENSHSNKRTRLPGNISPRHASAPQHSPRSGKARSSVSSRPLRRPRCREVRKWFLLDVRSLMTTPSRAATPPNGTPNREAFHDILFRIRCVG